MSATARRTRHPHAARRAAAQPDPLRHHQPARQRARVHLLHRGAADARPGIETTIRARDPERPNLIARLPGARRGSAAAALRARRRRHDRGPALAQPPFEAVEADGFIWGRGAVDMKGGVAMMLAAFLRARAEGLEPAGRRDLLRARRRGGHERLRRRVARARARRAVRGRAASRSASSAASRSHLGRAALLSDPGRREAGLHGALTVRGARWPRLDAGARRRDGAARAGARSGSTASGCRST